MEQQTNNPPQYSGPAKFVGLNDPAAFAALQPNYNQAKCPATWFSNAGSQATAMGYGLEVPGAPPIITNLQWCRLPPADNKQLPRIARYDPKVEQWKLDFSDRPWYPIDFEIPQGFVAIHVISTVRVTGDADSPPPIHEWRIKKDGIWSRNRPVLEEGLVGVLGLHPFTTEHAERDAVERIHRGMLAAGFPVTPDVEAMMGGRALPMNFPLPGETIGKEHLEPIRLWAEQLKTAAGPPSNNVELLKEFEELVKLNKQSLAAMRAQQEEDDRARFAST